MRTASTNVLERLLQIAAEGDKPNLIDEDMVRATYKEGVNNDARSERSEAWLKNHTSYIWKVGVLTLVDANKCDWGYAWIGILRNDTSLPELVGKFMFPDGENTDVFRVVQRAVALMQGADILFQE